MAQVIDSLEIANIVEQNEKLKNINVELKAKCEELSLVDGHTEEHGKQA